MAALLCHADATLRSIQRFLTASRAGVNSADFNYQLHAHSSFLRLTTASACAPAHAQSRRFEQSVELMGRALEQLLSRDVFNRGTLLETERREGGLRTRRSRLIYRMKVNTLTG